MIGIIDSYGIESFMPFELRQVFLLILRAKLNLQREAIFYCLDFTDKEINKINHLISSHEVKSYNEAGIFVLEKLNNTAKTDKLLNKFYKLRERL